jgi:NADPH:quinone reductase
MGERVWIWNAQWQRAFGTAAQYVALPSTQAVTLLSRIDYAAGACFGIPAFTALHAVRLAEARAGMTLLVVGGAGAVAHYAIQFAKARGARVITTTSSNAKAAHARDAGADEVINYREDNVGARVKALTDGRGVDAVIEMDLSGNAKAYPDILRPGATVVIYGMAAPEAVLPSLWLMRNSITLRFFLIYEISQADRAAELNELAQMLGDNRLIHTIGRRLPLEAVAEAHELLERGAVMGNIVLDIP